MNHNYITSFKQQGLTLIELMVTMVISLVLLTGVINVATSSLTTNKMSENNEALQDNARFALSLLTRDIQMAGFTGCLAYNPNSATDSADTFSSFYQPELPSPSLVFEDQLRKGIQGWEAADSAPSDPFTLVTESTLPVGTGGNHWSSSDGNQLTNIYAEAIENSDILRLWTAAEGFDIITGANPVPPQITPGVSFILTTDANISNFSPGDIIVYSNCKNRVIAQICEVNQGAGELTAFDSNTDGCRNEIPAYEQFLSQTVGGEIFRFYDVTYFVGKRDNNPNTAPSLFRAEDNTVREMVEGVESMQILYGIDLNPDDIERRSADVYVTADKVGARWNEVMSVRITLLLRSFQDKVVPDNATFSFNGLDNHESSDGRLRRAYTKTIALRNRTIGRVTSE